MVKTFSFTALEKEFSHGFRKKVNAAETVTDLKNLFSRTITGLLARAVPPNVKISDSDVGFDPEGTDLVKLTAKLHKSREIRDLLENSDLPRVMERFARSVHRRYIHLQKHSEKTNLKIRN